MTYPTYNIYGTWSADNIGPEGIAARFLEMMRRLPRLGPANQDWTVASPQDGAFIQLSDASPRMAEIIKHSVRRDDSGQADHDEGFRLQAEGCASADEPRGSDTARISVTAGSKWQNEATFEVGDFRYPPDFSLITYPIYLGALRTLAEVWPLPWALAYTFRSSRPPVDASKTRDNRRWSPFEIAWIAYLSPELTKDFTPPPALATQRTPGGGVVLSAIEGLIDQDNPEHMQRSRMLEVILRERVGLGAPKTFPADLPPRLGPW
jgi:hypothetical protein